MSQNAMRLARRALFAGVLALVACTPSTPAMPTATGVPVKRLATVPVSATPNEATLAAAQAAPATPTASPFAPATATPYIGIFIGTP